MINYLLTAILYFDSFFKQVPRAFGYKYLQEVANI
jgi:hypothetical protein